LQEIPLSGWSLLPSSHAHSDPPVRRRRAEQLFIEYSIPVPLLYKIIETTAKKKLRASVRVSEQQAPILSGGGGDADERKRPRRRRPFCHPKPDRARVGPPLRAAAATSLSIYIFFCFIKSTTRVGSFGGSDRQGWRIGCASTQLWGSGKALSPRSRVSTHESMICDRDPWIIWVPLNREAQTPPTARTDRGEMERRQRWGLTDH
jgi:hypothetical protein